jgi:hypothetical protein
VRDIWDHRRGRPKEEPTVGKERRPALAPDDAGPGELGPFPPPGAHGAESLE